MITDTGEHITTPEVNRIVFHKPWQGKKEMKKKAYPVIINSGQYLDSLYHRLSNFWDWQRVSPTGKINKKVESGYGNFTIASGYITSVNETSVVSAEGTTREVKRKITVL